MTLLIIFIIIIISNIPSLSYSTTTIGITYSSTSVNTTTTNTISDTITSLGLSSVLINSPNPNSIHSFLYTNTSLILTLPNSLVPSIASNRSAASQWLRTLVYPFFPRANIAAVSVGDASLLDSSPHFAPFVVPAARNLRLALADLGIHTVAVAPTMSFLSVMASSFFPPSAAQFRSPILRNLVGPVLEFLKSTNASFFVALYPYHVYRSNMEIPIGFALFQDHRFNFRDDLATGVRYRNLFDVMVDAVVCAMRASGHEGMPVVVAETGWPSGSSDPAEVDANPAYAELYVKGLVRHLRSGIGTPLRKEGVSEVYVHELFDTYNNETDRNRRWGILYPNLTAKFDVDFSQGVRVLGCVRIFYFTFVFFVFM